MEVKASTTGMHQYVVFKVADQEFGAEIHKISIIEKKMNISRVPSTPAYIRGVINLRGEIIPIISLRLKFGLPEIETDDDTRMIIFKFNEIALGAIVDAVAEVVALSENDVENISAISNDRNYDYIMGIGKVNGRLITLLNIDKLITELVSKE